MTTITHAPACTLDIILHQPIRTRIVAYLVSREEATFMELKRVLEISDGNLESHMKKLILAGYIVIRKSTIRGRQQTLYLLTEAGRAALKTYIESLQELLGIRLMMERNNSAPSLNEFFCNPEPG